MQSSSSTLELAGATAAAPVAVKSAPAAFREQQQQQQQPAPPNELAAEASASEQTSVTAAAAATAAKKNIKNFQEGEEKSGKEEAKAKCRSRSSSSKTISDYEEQRGKEEETLKSKKKSTSCKRATFASLVELLEEKASSSCCLSEQHHQRTLLTISGIQRGAASASSTILDNRFPDRRRYGRQLNASRPPIAANTATNSNFTRVATLTSNYNNKAKKEQKLTSQQQQLSLAAKERGEEEKELGRVSTKIARSYESNKIRKMRNIITPVNYNKQQSSDSSSSSISGGGDHTELDSLEIYTSTAAEHQQQALEFDDDDDDDEQRDELNRSSKLRASTKGVAVLPSQPLQRIARTIRNEQNTLLSPSSTYPTQRAGGSSSSLHRKLVKTNWQPPTDGRQYETKAQATSSDHFCPLSSSSSSKKILANNEPDYYYPLNNSTPSTTDILATSPPTTTNSHIAAYNTSSRVGRLGPTIVKHQRSSSRRLLNQLARLRRLSEPKYSVSRPEKVAKVEALIEELERATIEWEEDELLLDRAERRDWPMKYYEHYPISNTKNNINNNNNNDNQFIEQQKITTSETEQQMKDNSARFERIQESANNQYQENTDEYFNTTTTSGIHRTDVLSLEEREIAKSHSIYSSQSPTRLSTLHATEQEFEEDNLNHDKEVEEEEEGEPTSWLHSKRIGGSIGSSLTSSTLPRASTKKHWPTAFADRYSDDLAVRRLQQHNHLVDHHNPQAKEFSHGQQQIPQMSYLLCSNAYTPPINCDLTKTPLAPPSPRRQQSSATTTHDHAPTRSLYDTLQEQRVRVDDLHYRNVKPKLDPHEPPFGIPRHINMAAAHSTSSHYLRRPPYHQQLKPTGGSLKSNLNKIDSSKAAPTATEANWPPLVATHCHCPSCCCVCTNHHDHNHQQQHNHHSYTKRSDSKVSFARDGRASVDSGLVESPSSLGGATHSRLSASARLSATPTTPTMPSESKKTIIPKDEKKVAENIDGDDDDDVAEEVDLGDEFGSDVDPRWLDEEAGCGEGVLPIESPTLEKFQAQFRATPVRRRPKIKLENPRAKSPLLKTAPPSTAKEASTLNKQNIPPPPPTKSTNFLRNTSYSPSYSRAATGIGGERKKQELDEGRADADDDDSGPHVQVQCYTDSLKRQRHHPQAQQANPMEELEMQYDFCDDGDDDDDDYDHEDENERQRRLKNLITDANFDSSCHSSSACSSASKISPPLTNNNNNNSLEQINDPKRNNNNNKESWPKSGTSASGKGSGPKFSIGQYKPLNKPDLKIL